MRDMKLIDFNNLYYNIQYTIGYCTGIMIERFRGEADSILTFKDLTVMDLLSIGGNDGVGIYIALDNGELEPVTTTQVDEILLDIHIDEEGEYFNTVLKKMAIFNAYQGAYNLINIMAYQFDVLTINDFKLILQIYIERIIEMMDTEFGITLDVTSITECIEYVFSAGEEDNDL